MSGRKKEGLTFKDLPAAEQGAVIINERTPKKEEVIYKPTVEFLDPEGELTREEKGNVIAMGDRTAISYRNLAKTVLEERDNPPVEIEGESVDAVSAFYLQYALSARSSDEIAHTSVLEQINVGKSEMGGDSPIILEGVSILSALRDICSLRHFGFEAFSSRGGVFPEGYWRIPSELMASQIGDELETINQTVYGIYLELTEKAIEYYLQRTQKRDDEKWWQYKWRVLNLALDDSRQVTNGTFLNHLSMHPNSALSIREGISELSSKDLPETRQIARRMRELAESGLPTLMRYTEASPFTRSLREKRKILTAGLGLLNNGDIKVNNERESKLLGFEVSEDSARNFLTAFIANEGEVGYTEARDRVDELDQDLIEVYLEKIFEGMGLHDKPPKELEVIQVRADYLMSLGAIYESIRHRLVTHLVSRLSPKYGYTIPEVFKETGKVDRYKAAMTLNEVAYDLIRQTQGKGSPYAEYFVARGHLIPYSMRISGMDIFHYLKLRSSPSAHPDISGPSSELARLLKETQNSVFKHLVLKE